MSEWIECKLGDIAVVKGGKRLPKGELLVTEKTPHPYIRITDFDGYKINLSGIQYVKETVQKSISRYTVNKNDIILSIVGTIGLCAKVPDELDNANLTENCVKLIFDKTKIDTDYLYYHLISPDTQDLIGSLDVGSTQPKLPIYNVQKIDIYLPPIEEQKAITGVLSSLDHKIDLLHRQNHTLEELAQTLFRQWFIEEVEDDWEIGTLSDIIEFNPTYKLKQGTLATYLAMENVRTNASNTSGWYQREVSSGAKFMNNDTLLARITPSLENGKTAFVDFLESGEIGWGSTELIVMRMKNGFHPFISYLIAKNQDFRDFAIGNMTGSTGRQRAQAEDLKKYEIVIPASNIVKKLNEVIEPIPPKIQANWKQIQTLENLRDTLLPKLLNGEARIQA